MKEITLGMMATATTIVTEENIAKTMKSGDLPVFATPAMCALMEEAAKTAVLPALDEGEGTVGISLGISHDSPSPLGATITATATVTQVDGKKITFAIEASDGTRRIGQGSHERFVIDNEKFLTKLQNR